MQKGAISASECIRTGQNGWSPGSKFVIPCHCGSYRACCYISYVCMEPVERRGSYAEMSRYWTTARDDHHLFHMALTDRPASSTVLSQRWSTAMGLDLSPSTVHCRLLRAGLVACMLLHQLPLSRDHQHLRLQWAHERQHWHAEWRNVVFQTSPSSTCPAMMAEYEFDATLVNAI